MLKVGIQKVLSHNSERRQLLIYTVLGVYRVRKHLAFGALYFEFLDKQNILINKIIFAYKFFRELFTSNSKKAIYV